MADVERRACPDPATPASPLQGMPRHVDPSSFGHDHISIAPDFTPSGAQPAWRQDFPIDWPQDLYVERRDFLRFMVLTSAAFTTGQLWIAVQNWYRRHRGRPPVRRVASLAEVPVGGSLVFRYPDEHEPCLLVRLSVDEFVAFNQKCTHLSCAVVPRPAENSLFCPCHNGRFDLRTGVPIAGPPKRPLTRIVLERRGSDIYAVGVEARTT